MPTKTPHIGFWISNSKPERLPTLVRARFMVAAAYQVPFFAFCSRDVDLERQKIQGTFFEDGAYVKRETDFPQYIDLRLGTGIHKKNRTITEALKTKGTFIPNASIGTKDQINQKLLQDETHCKYAIPSYTWYPNLDISAIVDHYGTIILKPKNGSNGRGIYKITNTSPNYYEIHYLTEKTPMTRGQLLHNVQALDLKNYMIQQYINSSTQEGTPFDIRLNVACGLDGTYKITSFYARYGAGGYVGTNMGKAEKTQSVNVKGSLIYQFGEKEGKRLYEEIISLSQTFPVYFASTKKILLPELAMDIGVCRDSKQLYLFEVGVSPGTTVVVPYEIAEQNVGYYKYLIEEKNHDENQLV